MAGWLTDGVTKVSPGSNYSQVTASALLSLDTQLAAGGIPQTVAPTAFQIVMLSVELAANTATSTAGAATLNTKGGTITTESLTTAVGATY